ncbi:hypothetical protein SCLO_1014170 [Sphingobium cloacae]|uniref:Uncharacterized protein n=1 Tax=Sphingobium cloacae TaxID=120107 RepID=A0A1E1F1R1_9SPHN|nr:hypothetical protein SCLO_1014170 [Sphingobium cloacae]
MQETSDTDRLTAHGQRIRKSGALGKSLQINRLFDLLLERSLAGTAAKEIDIAQNVFGRSTDVDLAADATVRVYAHRLRKKLDAVPADEQGERLILPRGEYRLVVVPADAEAGDHGDDPVMERPHRRAWRWLAAAVAFLALNLLCWFWFANEPSRDPRLDTIFWKGLANDRTPALIVSGDYYVFGEQGPNGAIQRMIADPAITSSEDLTQYKMHTPGADKAYVDMNAYHLPEGLASALASIAPIVTAARSGKANPPRSITISRFTNDMLTSQDIVYVGLLSTLRELQEPLFSLSGFSLSASSDTLVDRASGHRFQSDWADPSRTGILRRDYAYLARLPGPSGNQILVIAGTRDPALVEAAQIASDKAELSRLQARLGKGEAFEALYEVRTFGPSNISRQLLIARPLHVDRMWPARKDAPVRADMSERAQ